MRNCTFQYRNTSQVLFSCFNTFSPVSYTHLDVYKRQGNLHATGSTARSRNPGRTGKQAEPQDRPMGHRRKTHAENKKTYTVWNFGGEDFHSDYLSMSNIKKYIDWAKQQGWEYFTLDKCCAVLPGAGQPEAHRADRLAAAYGQSRLRCGICGGGQGYPFPQLWVYSPVPP